MRGLFLLALAVMLANAAGAQSLNAPLSPVLVITQERLFTDSIVGKEIVAREMKKREALLSESREIDKAFEAEERDLTERRSKLSKEEFRALADAFDARVVAARKRQEQKSQDILKEMEEVRRAFFVKAAPILQKIMVDYNAVILLDQRSVLLSDNRINITDEAIARLNQAFGSISDIIGE
ncbi:MAG: OmpH family outer membrane protein [Paracoccaceae bacterium]